MFFVSNKSNLRFVVRSDVTEPKFDQAGKVHPITHSPVVYAQFKPDRHLPREFRVFAVAYFNNPGMRGTQYQRPGIEMDRLLTTAHSGITGLGDQFDGVTVDGKGFGADDPLFKLGILDTSDPNQVKPEDKAEVEATLMSNPLRGQSYINFDNTMALPWPAYVKIKASDPADVKKVIQRIADLEEDGRENVAEYVIEFEQAQDKPRSLIIKAVEQYIADRVVVA